jgi:hypothetical protein
MSAYEVYGIREDGATFGVVVFERKAEQQEEAAILRGRE